MRSHYGPCCCACVILHHLFDWEPGDDGVNRQGQSIYTFTEGDWEVTDAATGWDGDGVLRSLGGDPIHFYDEIANGQASIKLTPGTFCKLSSGGHYHKLSLNLAGDEYESDFDGDIKTYPTDAGLAQSLHLSFYPKPDPYQEFDAGGNETYWRLYQSFYSETEAGPPVGLMQGHACEYVEVDIDAETWDWTLEASAGVEIGQLRLTASERRCEGANANCHHFCLEDNPEIILLTIGGLGDTESLCLFDECPDYADCVIACESDLADCMSTGQQSYGVYSPQITIVECAEVCACNIANAECMQACEEACATTTLACPGAALNDTWALDKVVDPDNGESKCGDAPAGPECYWETMAPLGTIHVGGCGTGEGEDVGTFAHLVAEAVPVSVDPVTALRTMRLSFYMPWTLDPLLASTEYRTINFDTDEFCTGIGQEMHASNPVLYADEISFHYYKDGDVATTTCEHDPDPVGCCLQETGECTPPDEAKCVKDAEDFLHERWSDATNPNGNYCAGDPTCEQTALNNYRDMLKECSKGQCHDVCDAIDTDCTDTCDADKGNCESACDTAKSSCDAGCTDDYEACEDFCVGDPECIAACEAARTECLADCETALTTCYGVCESVHSDCLDDCAEELIACDTYCDEEVEDPPIEDCGEDLPGTIEPAGPPHDPITLVHENEV